MLTDYSRLSQACEANGDDVINVSLLLKAAAEKHPFKRAVVYRAARDKKGRAAYAHFTFQQLDQESDRLAHGLERIGIHKGTRTIVMVPFGLEFVAITYALLKVGAVPVMLDPGMGLRRMLVCLKNSTPEAFVGVPLAHALRLASPGYFGTVKHLVTVGRRWLWGGSTLADLEKDSREPFCVARTESEDTAALFFTTGSTGPPKAVVYTHGMLAALLRQIQSEFGNTVDVVDMPTFPLFALFDPALGVTAVLPDMNPTRPAHADPAKIVEAIIDHGVTDLFASPALLNVVGRYGKAMGIKLPSLNRVVSAGAPVSPANISQFSTMLRVDAEIHTPYGATEALPVTSIGSREILSETRRLTEQGGGMCVGLPVDGVDVRIIQISDEPIERWSDDLLLPDGEIGEITVNGNRVSRLYYGYPEATALAKITDGTSIWHRMGDLGWRDDKGRIWFCGRKAHRVQLRTRTLFTVCCEAVFNKHPKVSRSALVGVGPASSREAVLCIEPKERLGKKERASVVRELRRMAEQSPVTEGITRFAFFRSFPVDIRHNSKIFREALAERVQRQRHR